MALIALMDFIATVDKPTCEGWLFEKANDVRHHAKAIYAKGMRTPKYDAGAVRALAPIVAKEILSVAEHHLHASTAAKQDAFNRGIGDPGHGWGHWAWDYVHALLLSSDRELDAGETELTVLSGTLHDLATAIVPRYGESGRVLRHAEVGALLVQRALWNHLMLDDDDCALVAHAVLEHSHYRTSATITCRDGVERVTEASFDEIDGRPLYLPWTTRWVDRLSATGPVMLARHYLTLHQDHEDFGNGGFYGVKYANHMRPLLRSDEEIKAAGGARTIGEHFRMFADSQTNATPYGKHDKGLMVSLRDFGVDQSRIILAALEHPVPVDVDLVMLAWNRFLMANAEPSENGRRAVDALDRNFRRLPAEDRRTFASMFSVAMNEYFLKAEKTLSQLENLGLPETAYCFWPMADVRDFVRPDESWASVIRAR